MKKIFAFVLMAVLVLSLSAAAFAAPAYNVGICQLVQHPALDAATQGFQDALTEKLGEDAVKFSVQNASGDSATCAVICNQFVSDEVDLILANATPALLATPALMSLLSSTMPIRMVTMVPSSVTRTLYTSL